MNLKDDIEVLELLIPEFTYDELKNRLRELKAENALLRYIIYDEPDAEAKRLAEKEVNDYIISLYNQKENK